jgi:hypothetical protein
MVESVANYDVLNLGLPRQFSLRFQPYGSPLSFNGDDTMTSRFTQTEKWDDAWFRELSPNAKVLYWYIWDKCNIAGFWEVDLEGAVFHTKIPRRGLQGAYEELTRGFEVSGGYLWIRRFLYHQKNLPLTPDTNPAHRGILRAINEYKVIFPNVLAELEKQVLKEKTEGATEGLVSPISISKGISKGIRISKKEEKPKSFTPPTFEEVKKYITENPELSNVNAETFFKGFNDSGWIDTRGNPVKNWKLKLRTWSSYGTQKPAKPDPTPPPVERGADGLTPRERMKKGLANG